MLGLRHGLIALALAFAVPACGGGDDDDDKQGTGNQEETGEASKEISAEDGGELTLGDAKLSIPGGALSEDLTVTVVSKAPSSSLPSSGSLKGLVYDFGPDGTTFNAPVTLTLPAAGTPGEGKEAVIAWLDEEAGEWQDLTTSKGSDGALSAEITHFTRFVVRFIDSAGNVPDVSCEDFTACGGDPVGTWTIAGACIDTGDDENPFEDCPEGEFGVDVTATGTLEITGDEFEWNLTVEGSAVFTLPAVCLERMTMGTAIECSVLTDDDDAVCTGTYATGCSCSVPVEPTTQVTTGTYVVDGNTIVATEDGEDEAGDPSEFCVRGNQMRMKTVKIDDDDGSVEETIIVLNR